MKRLLRLDNLLFLILLTVSANAFVWIASDLGTLFFVVPAVLAAEGKRIVAPDCRKIFAEKTEIKICTNR